MSVSVLFSDGTATALGGQAQLDAGTVGGALVASGVVTLVAGTATVSVGTGVLTLLSRIYVVPANNVANANAGNVTAVSNPGLTAIVITSTNGADVGTYLYQIFSSINV